MYIESSSLFYQNQHEEQQSSLSYQRITDTELQTIERVRESETLALLASGTVRTKTGDVLDITLQSSLTRSANYQTSSSVSLASLVDPLVINLNGGLAEIDESGTFSFDLNGDGTKEQISLLGNNNGFLAYDKNGNGKIDDGSELFGTKSGNGFADLAAFDEDGNGWIDENDSIFSKLKIWQKSATKDNLISLTQAQVGALLLESTETSFSYKKDAKTNAILQESSVVLFENGNVGWLSHVDFAVQNSSDQNENSGTRSTPSILSSSLSKLHNASSSGTDNMLSILKNRLKALQNKLSKTHDSTEKSVLMVQILKISMQISMLGG